MHSSLAENEAYKDTRFILYHKSSSSGRTVFFRPASGGVCVFDGLPKLAQIIDEIIKPNEDDNVITLPTPLLTDIANWLGLDRNELEIDNDYFEQVDVADGLLNIYLVRFKIIDPPFEAAERVDAKFCLLTELRDLEPAELDLLRQAYTAIMGG